MSNMVLKPRKLEDMLAQGMNRIASYQTIQKGVDMRDGNVTLSDTNGDRRAVFGKLRNGEFVVAISAENVDVHNALGV